MCDQMSAAGNDTKVYRYNVDTNVLTPQNAAAAAGVVRGPKPQPPPTPRIQRITEALNKFDPMHIREYGDNYGTFAKLLDKKLVPGLTDEQTLSVVTTFFSKGVGGAPHAISKECGTAVWNATQ